MSKHSRRTGAYRRFRIKTVEGTDDFASMREVVTRRLKRSGRGTATEEANVSESQAEQPNENEWTRRPDLMIIDGGKGQLGAALDALHELGIEDQPIAALAKQNEELFLPGRPDPVVLPRDSQALFLVQRLRDEAHRFAVTYHRNVRGKRAIVSGLDEIRGIGAARKKALVRRFGSVSELRRASMEDIASVPGIGEKLAASIKSQLGGA
jgi:excinuclease ABC subunit C